MSIHCSSSNRRQSTDAAGSHHSRDLEVRNEAALAAISGTGNVELGLVVQYPNIASSSTFIYGTPLTIVA